MLSSALFGFLCVTSVSLCLCGCFCCEIVNHRGHRGTRRSNQSKYYSMFFQLDHAEQTVRASFAFKYERLRRRAFGGRGGAARDVLQFTHSLERTPASRGAVLAGRVCDAARARVVDLTRTPLAWSKDSRRWLGRGVADRSLFDRARGS